MSKEMFDKAAQAAIFTWLAICAAIGILGATPGCVKAEEEAPKPAAIQAEVKEDLADPPAGPSAKEESLYRDYVQNVQLGFQLGAKLGLKKEAIDVREDLMVYLREGVIPWLKEEGMYGEWLKVQQDPDFIKSNLDARKCTKLSELFTMAREQDKILKDGYPAFYKAMNNMPLELQEQFMTIQRKAVGRDK